MKMKEESEKAGLKFNIEQIKIMVSGPITSWQIDGETVETVSDFIFGGSKITAAAATAAKSLQSCPITSWETDGETVETVADFIFLGFKITADDDCSHEIKRRFLLGRKVMTNLDSTLKSRDITLPNKGPSSQGYGFSSGHVWMRELDCEES